MSAWVNDTRGRVTILTLALGTVLLLGLVVGFLADVPQLDQRNTPNNVGGGAAVAPPSHLIEWGRTIADATVRRR